MKTEVARNSSKRKKVAGRQKGTPNKVTTDVRAAIARVLETNAANFSVWLAGVAEGLSEPRLNDEGEPLLDDQGHPIVDWLRRPEPGTALKLAMDMAEFHIPKLARTELVGNNKQPIAIAVEFVSARK
jgi:hypothetical protein